MDGTIIIGMIQLNLFYLQLSLLLAQELVYLCVQIRTSSYAGLIRVLDYLWLSQLTHIRHQKTHMKLPQFCKQSSLHTYLILLFMIIL